MPPKSAALLAACALARPAAGGCAKCGHVPPKRTAPRAVRKVGRLEVNHRIPCLGAHGELSCAHHLANLETLCVACHRAHTSALCLPKS